MTEALNLTPELIEKYLTALSAKSGNPETVLGYRRVLKAFYDFLPDKKEISGEEVILSWGAYLKEKGYAVRSINSRISTVNGFLVYCGKKEWKAPHVQSENDSIRPELTRAEYLRLLSTAKLMKKERIYLIIKTICTVGLAVRELGCVTVEAAKEGKIVLSSVKERRSVYIPAVLRKELTDYAESRGIRSGQVFITSGGNPVNRSNIWSDMQKLCKDAQIPEEKVNPRCLYRLYHNTYGQIEDNISVLIEKAYERLLEQEQTAIGWEN